MQLKVKVKDLENTNSYETADKLIVLTDETTNISKNLDKSDLLTDIVSSDATNGLNIQNGGLYNKDVSNIIGDLSDLTTPVKSNVVNAVNSIQNTINTDLNKIGDLSELTTTDKTSLVGAVNELYNSISANNDLSNLSTNGENRLHALKGYVETGSAYTDSQLYNDILAQYNNSFDLSKFTVVGTPTITDDGIITSWNDINRVSNTISGGGATNFEIHYRINVPNHKYTSDNTFTQLLYISNSGDNPWTLQIYTQNQIELMAYGDGFNYVGIMSQQSTVLPTIDYFDIVIKNNGTNFTISVILPDGTVNKTTTSSTAGSSLPLETVTIYTNRNSYFSTGTPIYNIDLKKYSITVNGVEVFSGHKTGTDTYYTDNYTVVGTPTITDGIASGFSGSNYITSSTYKNNLGNADTWSIEFYGVTPSSFSSGGGYQGFFGSATSNRAPSLQSVVESGSGGTLGKIRLLISSNNSSWNIADTKSTDTFAVDTLIGVRLDFTGTQYLLYTKIPNGDWKLQITVNSSTKVYNTNELFQLGSISSTGSNYWRGGIKLNSIRIIENGVLVYSSDLSIPYTISDIGSKIVNINDIGSLQMLNNMSGGALYYTIDETNSEAALPFGNVYGLINKRADGDWENLTGSNIELSTVTAVNTYDIDLSSYITSNLYDYEAVFDIDAKRTDNNSNATNYIVSLLLNDGTAIANYSNTFYKAQSYGDQFSVLLPKNIRKIRLQISGYALSSHSLKLLAWRRKGGNY